MRKHPIRRWGWRVAARLAGLGLGWWLTHETPQRLDWQGKVVLITGGSRGLGFVLATLCARRGAKVVICARDANELASAQEQLAATGGEIATFLCDVTDREAVERMVGSITNRIGHIDMLINNAGIITTGPLASMTLDDFREVMEINFWGAVNATMAVLPSMQARCQGHIATISSIGGKISVPHLMPYSCAKFALQGFSEGLHAELVRDGITVTTIAPGLMRTGSYRNVTVKGRHQAEYTLFALLDSLPIMSMPAQHAAQQILAAIEQGRAELVLTLPAKLAVATHALLPQTTAALLRATAAILPNAGPDGMHPRVGHACETPLTRSALTADNQLAAMVYNEEVTRQPV